MFISYKSTSLVTQADPMKEGLGKKVLLKMDNSE